VRQAVPPRDGGTKVYNLSDTLSPKGVTLTVDQRDQNVRIIAVDQPNQGPLLPQAPKSS
jgi:hypothetical protein